MTTLSPPPASAPSAPPANAPVRLPTIWGLNPIQLHDYFWAARGVQVVRLGANSNVVEGAELFLLTDARTLTLFRVRSLLDTLSWNAPVVLFTRVHEERPRPYREHARTDSDGRFIAFERSYPGTQIFVTRTALTRDPDVARAWQAMTDVDRPWRLMRTRVNIAQRECASVHGHFYNRNDPDDLRRYIRDIVTLWRQPSATIGRAVRLSPAVWADESVTVSSAVKFVGNVWVGAGRTLDRELVVGPAILWDAPEQRPVIDTIEWENLEPAAVYGKRPELPRRSSLSRGLKRAFDVIFALIALLLTAPLYPFIILAIFIEDGRPFFFGHTRETLGARMFSCLKFRSMRKDAEQIKARLMQHNQADGPQFFIENDPRLTRVGRFLRKTNLDEIPQFVNVLVGQMSIVGPRPSPRNENQYCPPWREARLSVRPGITGLWQVNRTRIRGADFQEWIKYDIEYVEKQSWLLDLRIIWKTLLVVLRGVTSP